MRVPDIPGDSNTAEYARHYIDHAFSPIPIPFGEKSPVYRGWPDIRIGEYEVPRHFKGNAQNIGVILGEASGWTVDVDLDVPEAFTIADRFLPPTLTSGRPSAVDSHWWYVASGAKTKKWRDLQGKTLLELRSSGAQTVVEPSVHPEGETYRWNREGCSEIVEVPADDLLQWCKELATATLIARHLPAGGRHDHYALPLAGYLLKPGRMDEETTIKILLAAWHAGGGYSKEAIRDLQGIVKSTAQKLATGGAVVGGPTLGRVAPGLIDRLAAWWGWSADAGTVSTRNDNSPPTHDELRDRWLRRYPDTAYGLGGWQRYGSGVWVPVHDRLIENEISGVLEEAKTEGIRPTSALLASVERLSQAKTAVPDEWWESNEEVLVCANGTLDVATGNLREHSPRDYARSAVPYAYDPEAAAPVWASYLEAAVPEAAGFLQEFAGYCLTPDTSHEQAVWLYGPPGCGKSTFIEGLTAMLGARAGVLGLADLQNNRFALSSLPGKTLLHATEQPSDYVRSTHLLNAIISGEPLPVEKKFKDPITVVPRAKVCWAMNDLPKVGDANSGLFRRVSVIAFPKLQGNPDPEIKRRIKDEGAGILVWALEGLRRLRERGHFEFPGSVQSATDDFRRTNDIPGLFVSEACSTGEGKVQSSHLYEAYKAWCRVNGHRALSSTSVAKEWVRLGFEKKINQGRHYYHGLSLDASWVQEHMHELPFQISKYAAPVADTDGDEKTEW